MGLWGLLKSLFGVSPPAGDETFGQGVLDQAGGALSTGKDVAELPRRLGMSEQQLRAVQPRYERFYLPKRSGGQREIEAPSPELKEIQRRILRRLLGRLQAHPAAHGFERGRSIVTNALPHTRAEVVIRMDVQEFFRNTKSGRVWEYFELIGWDRKAAELLTALCTHHNHLPQGAPTSPRLSNLVNYAMDARLSAMARAMGALYTRYADDLTFSFASLTGVPRRTGLAYDPMTGKRMETPWDPRQPIRAVIASTKAILWDSGYGIHHRKKLRVARRHQSQRITGLVVNEKVALPRATRRRLRAIRHHLRTGRPATLNESQLAGWDAFEGMIDAQSRA